MIGPVLLLLLAPFTCHAGHLPGLLRPGSVGVPGPRPPPPAPRTPGSTLSQEKWARRSSGSDDAGPGFVRMPLRRQEANLTDVAMPPALRRRWGWSHLYDWGGIVYLIDLEIGTPPQTVTVFVDTGSYELWVNPDCDRSPDPDLCRTYGFYYPDESGTSRGLGKGWAYRYGTGSVRGQYYTDRVGIAQMSVPAAQFVVAEESDYPWAGLMGLGYGYPWTTDYQTLLQLLWTDGIIGAPVFSLGIGGEGDGFSEIIFGGVNRWKFAGRLEPVPIWPPIEAQDPHWKQYYVNVTSVGMTRPGSEPVLYTPVGQFSMPILLDTGSTLSYFRADLVAVIAQQFNARVDEGGSYKVDCSYRDQDGSVDFGFNNGNMVINVPYRDFIVETGSGSCDLGVQPADVGSQHYVFGDTFIRGAYKKKAGLLTRLVVFDQQSDVIWLSQYYNCGDGVVTVGRSLADTQFVVGAC